MGMVKGQGHIVGPESNWFNSFSFHINQTNTSWDTHILKFDLEKPKVKVMGEVKQRSRSHNSSSIQLIHLLFVLRKSDQPDMTWDMANRVFGFERKYIFILIH